MRTQVENYQVAGLKMSLSDEIKEKLQKQMKQNRPYYAIIIPVGNIRDTMIIGEQLEKETISSYLGSYEGLDYESKIKPVTLFGLKIIDNFHWYAKRIDRLNKKIDYKRLGNFGKELKEINTNHSGKG